MKPNNAISATRNDLSDTNVLSKVRMYELNMIIINVQKTIDITL